MPKMSWAPPAPLNESSDEFMHATKDRTSNATLMSTSYLMTLVLRLVMMSFSSARVRRVEELRRAEKLQRTECLSDP